MRLHKWKWCALWQELHKYVLLSGGPWSSMDGSSIMFKRPDMPSSNVPSTTGVWSAPCCRPYWWLKRGYLRAKLLRLAGLPPTKCVLILFDSQNFHPWQFRPSEWKTRWQSWEHTKIDAKVIYSGSYCGRSRQFVPWLLQITCWSYQFLRTLGDLCFPACLLFLKLVALVGRTQVCAKWPTRSQLLWIRRPPESDYNSTSQSSCSFLQRKHWDSQWLKLLHVPENFWSYWMSAKRINPGCLCLPTMDRCQILCLTSSNCCRREGWGLEDQVLASSW